MRHVIPEKSFEKPLLLPGSVILLSSDFPFGTFGRAYRTMSFWLNAVVPADHHRQHTNSIQSLFEIRFRFCAQCGYQDRRACTHHQKVYKLERFPRRPRHSSRLENSNGGRALSPDSLNHAASQATSYRCGRGPAELRFGVRMLMSDSKRIQ